MRLVTECQICASQKLEYIISLGHMPPVNQLIKIGSTDTRSNWLPTDLLYCPKCHLVQLGIIADREIVFPDDYPYTSGTTKLLRDNFANLTKEALDLFPDTKSVIDVGSNDGTLLKCFKDRGCDVLGFEPTAIADVATKNGIRTIKTFFDDNIANNCDPVDIVTMTNCFAHIDDVHGVVRNVKKLLRPGGVFISENHYLLSMLADTQFDAIYHEHLRYYSINALQYLFNMHDMAILTVTRIPTHGGSMRVYAVKRPLHYEPVPVEKINWLSALNSFASDTRKLKIKAMNTFSMFKLEGKKIAGISCPSRASTMMHYFGIDEDIIDYIVEHPASQKIGRYAPGTRIPICHEETLLRDNVDTAFIFAWHIADELETALRAKGYEGQFLRPLPF